MFGTRCKQALSNNNIKRMWTPSHTHTQDKQIQTRNIFKHMNTLKQNSKTALILPHTQNWLRFRVCRARRIFFSFFLHLLWLCFPYYSVFTQTQKSRATILALAL